MALLHCEEGTYHLPVVAVRYPDYRSPQSGRVRGEPFFDLERVYIFATADDYVFEAAGDAAVTLRVQNRLVAGSQPDRAVLVFKERLGRFAGVLPVSLVDLVSGHAQFPSLPDFHGLSGARTDDLRLGVRHDLAYGR